MRLLINPNQPLQLTKNHKNASLDLAADQPARWPRDQAAAEGGLSALVKLGWVSGAALPGHGKMYTLGFLYILWKEAKERQTDLQSVKKMRQTDIQRQRQ